MADLQKQVVKYLTDAHALEQQSLAALKGLISTSDDEAFRRHFEHHHAETEEQLRRVEARLSALGESPSTAKDLATKVASMGKGAGDLVRSDNAGKNLRDFYVNEQLEIASYELLERVAALAGDTETAAVARTNREEERAEAEWAATQWDRAAALSLQEEGAVG